MGSFMKGPAPPSEKTKFLSPGARSSSHTPNNGGAATCGHRNLGAHAHCELQHRPGARVFAFATLSLRAECPVIDCDEQ